MLVKNPAEGGRDSVVGIYRPLNPKVW